MTPEQLAAILNQPGYGIDASATAVLDAPELPAIAAKPAPGATRRKKADENTPYANELAMQRAYIVGLAVHYWEFPKLARIHAIPNQFVAGRPIAPAQRAGMPDHMLPVPVAPYHGFYAEAKWPGEEPSEKQLAIHQELRDEGYAVIVWDDVDTAVALTLAYCRGELAPF